MFRARTSGSQAFYKKIKKNMKREIKFRAKAKDGEWVYGSPLMHPLGQWFIIRYVGQTPRFTLVDGETIGQGTGVTDTEGKEIFEGDIIQRAGEPAEHRAVVEWEDSELRGFGYYRLNGCIGYMARQGVRMKVVGNIHDNPELLEE